MVFGPRTTIEKFKSDTKHPTQEIKEVLYKDGKVENHSKESDGQYLVPSVENKVELQYITNVNIKQEIQMKQEVKAHHEGVLYYCDECDYTAK